MLNFFENIIDKVDNSGPVTKSFFMALSVLLIVGLIFVYIFLIITLPILYSVITLVFGVFLVLWGNFFLTFKAAHVSDDELDIEVDEYINNEG